MLYKDFYGEKVDTNVKYLNFFNLCKRLNKKYLFPFNIFLLSKTQIDCCIYKDIIRRVTSVLYFK